MITLHFFGMLLYSTPSMILYTMTIFMVNRFSKDFSITFLKLYISFFVFNTITFFNSFITIRFPQNTCRDCILASFFQSHTIENPSRFPLHLFYALHYSMGYVQFLMIFLTSVNRFSMIFWRITYERTWNKYFYLILLCVVLFPIPFTWTVLTGEAYYVYIPSLDNFKVTSTMNRDLVYNQLVLFFAFITIMTAIINIASFYYLSCITSKISIAERNLLFMSGSLFLIQLIADVNTTLSRLDKNQDMVLSQIATTLLPYISDGLTFIHPWLLLLCSSRARTRFLKMYIPGYSKLEKRTNSISIFLPTTTSRKSLQSRNLF